MKGKKKIKKIKNWDSMSVGKLVVKTEQNKDLPAAGFSWLNFRSIPLLFAAV